MSVIPSFLILSLLLLIHSSNGFDITQILNQYPDFSNFNSYLSQTNLASAINSRNTITVLVVDNANIASLSSRSPDVIKNILSVHIILDYYDVTKLQQLTATSPLPTTLFQSTGLALGQQGFLNVTHPSTASITFGSAMPGSTQTSTLVKSVTSEPYNLSILQISSPIIPQSIDGVKTSAPAATTAATATPPPPAPATANATTTTPPPLPQHPPLRQRHHSPSPSTSHCQRHHRHSPPANATATATPPPANATVTAPPTPAPQPRLLPLQLRQQPQQRLLPQPRRLLQLRRLRQPRRLLQLRRLRQPRQLPQPWRPLHLMPRAQPRPCCIGR
ncbi:fasciclin-like arabinogalactan protein 14 [Salvia splendens]|uniref:fasciclin-like arabinogalactan protein 14 n=1 Tax=Salvia splendens TaxID=180675 RepID=UPI001C2596C7|nr:fasciclin-like arabinogalactan protein 14 [Salvia splendens]